jgi:hypothetical protein
MMIGPRKAWKLESGSVEERWAGHVSFSPLVIPRSLCSSMGIRKPFSPMDIFGKREA